MWIGVRTVNNSTVRQRRPSSGLRPNFILLLFQFGVLLLLGRVVYLQVVERERLEQQGEARVMREVEMPVRRGMILDRHGEPLAISAPVYALWTEPRQLIRADHTRMTRMARLLDLKPDVLQKALRQKISRDFMYLRRQVDPDLAREVIALDIPGVFMRREHRRYYPAGEVTAQLLGFTDIDGHGQEGAELLYNDMLSGQPGRKRVLKDRRGRIVENVESISAMRPGHDLRLTLDRRLQYLAYRELKTAVHKFKARSGTLVMMDPRNGDVLAMASQPSYNPNNPQHLEKRYHRNAAMLDSYEPGSTVKPFTMLAALMSGEYTPQSEIDTKPGYMRIGGYTVRDFRNYGVLDLTGILKKSSNVGISRLGLSLDPELLWSVFDKVGLGHLTGSGFPGEYPGTLRHFSGWSSIDHATLCYGYGLSLTAVQLARAYTVLASGGILRDIRLHSEQKAGAMAGERVLPADPIRSVLSMLEQVVQPTGTGKRAAVAEYRIAGKTGTVRKSVNGSYAEGQYQALFVGMAPASDPRLVLVVVIDEPDGEKYYGGQVAAPVFSKVMTSSLRLLNVPPDNISDFSRLLITKMNADADEPAG